MDFIQEINYVPEEYNFEFNKLMKPIKFLSSILSLSLTIFGLAIILVKCGAIPTISIPFQNSSYIIISKERLFISQKRDGSDTFTSNVSGIVEEAKGNKDSALNSYNEAIKLDPNNDVHYSNRGMFFANSGDTKRAFSDYNLAIKNNPKNPITYDNRGFLKAQVGDKKGALSDYNQAIKIDPDFLASYINRSKVYEDIGDKEKAINDLRKVAGIYKINEQEKEYQQVIQYINSIK
jgi:tetratricopeptide (TPR) repeat protein